MAKSKKNNKSAKKSSVKVQDLTPEQNPKGGAAYVKIDYSTQLGDGSVLPAVQLDPSKIYIK